MAERKIPMSEESATHAEGVKERGEQELEKRWLEDVSAVERGLSDIRLAEEKSNPLNKNYDFSMSDEVSGEMERARKRLLELARGIKKKIKSEEDRGILRNLLRRMEANFLEQAIHESSQSGELSLDRYARGSVYELENMAKEQLSLELHEGWNGSEFGEEDRTIARVLKLAGERRDSRGKMEPAEKQEWEKRRSAWYRIIDEMKK